MTEKTVHPCTQYALDVLDGKYIVGQSEKQACKRHLDDLKREGAKDFPWVFNEEKANRIYEFFHYCNHIEGDPELVGRPIELVPFQKFYLGCIFGWVHKKTGYRRFEKAYIQLGRKNAKSTVESGIVLYLMIGDGEESPRVYCAAVDRQQARVVFDIAKSMAVQSPDISKRVKVQEARISHNVRGGVLMPLSKETKNKDAFNPSGAVIDEYHAHLDSKIYNLLSSARGHRAQYLIMIITTAGEDAENSPCFKEYEYCKQILSGAMTNEKYFVYICEMDKDDDEHDPKNWIKANPLLATLPNGIEALKQDHDEAFESKDPDKIRTFRIKRLNKWVYDSASGYIGELLPEWDKLSILPVSKSTPEQRREAFMNLVDGMPCLFGADLAKRIDLVGAGFVFYLPEEDKIAVCAKGFLPASAVLKHERTDKIPYRDWINDGWVAMTEGNVTDYAAVVDYLEKTEEMAHLKVQEVAYDPYNATHLASELIREGRTCVEVRQGVVTLSEPTKLFRDYIAQGKVIHDGSPALKWCLANAKEVHDNNENIKLSKENKDDTRRIDLLAAIINAMVRLSVLKGNKFKDLSDAILSEEFGF
ncbi:MAG: terminase large subunit [Pelolinea sp.]|nr:terminase large subunit [Pelolinea sp.]